MPHNIHPFSAAIGSRSWISPRSSYPPLLPGHTLLTIIPLAPGPQVISAPSDRCDPNSAPGRPINVRVQPFDGGARLCWDGVDGDQCVDQYRWVRAGPRVQGRSSDSKGEGGRK